MDSRVEFDVDVKPRVFSSEKVAIVAILLQEHSFFETLKNRVKTSGFLSIKTPYELFLIAT